MGETEGGFEDAGEAPIKQEYRLAPKPVLKKTADASEALTTESTVEENEACPCEGPPKKARLASILKSSLASTSEQTRFCKSVGLDALCEFGDQCRFSHDLAAFLASKPKDIGDVCPNVTAHGNCKYGLQCRFSMGHVDMKPSAATTEIIDKMALRTDDLRKRRIEFPRANAYIKSLTRNGEESSGNTALKESYPYGERKNIDFSGKTYLAPLTTVGNLPFRRICKEYGVDITCGEMAMSTNLLKGQMGEWALLKRHASEDVFGVQVCGAFADTLTRVAEVIDEYIDCDFVDLNMGCPIDIVYQKGMGSGLMERSGRMQQIIQGMSTVLRSKALTVKMRIGIADGKPLAHKLIPKIAQWGVAAVTVHGRTRQQRYTKDADWSYVSQCVDSLAEMDPLTRPAVIGNGDVMSWEDYEANRLTGRSDAIMIGRGALIKPWLFTEIKEQRHWDISSSERFSMLQRYANYALEHFGSDTAGVEKTRRFLLEWLSFLHRYVPIGLLERLPQRINQRPPPYYGRDELETLMASDQAVDWITLSERLLGPAPEGFKFTPKHRSNSYGVSAAERQQRSDS